MKRLVIVVKAGSKGAGTPAARTEDAQGGDKTFGGEGLSSSGKAPATHLWCSWWLPDAGHGRLTGQLKGLETAGNAQVYDATVWDQLEVDRLLVTLGLKRIGTALI